MAVGIQVVIDCADPGRLAIFWAAALRYKQQEPPAGFATWEAFLTAQGVPVGVRLMVGIRDPAINERLQAL